VLGQPVLPRADRVRYEDIAEDLRAYYRTTGARDLVEAEKRLRHLATHFAGWRIMRIDPPSVTAYVERRQAAAAANGTINGELAILGRMLKLAYENGKLQRVPIIRKLREADPRAGFFEPDAFTAVRARLRPDLQLAVTLAYTYGWRMQSEVLALERRQVDLKAGTLALDPGRTKNEDGRLVYLTPEIRALVEAQLARVDAVQKKVRQIIPFLFPHLAGRHRGQRLRDFRKAWETAKARAGLPGMLRHDFRRTAVRNLVNVGVPERVAMAITGHKTRSVFDRYHIVSPADLQAAATKLAGITPGITGDAHGKTLPGSS
jgi:integrase